MPVYIKSVSISPSTVKVGQTVNVTITADESDWMSLRTDFTDWGEVRRSFTNWEKIKNYIYSKPIIEADSDAIRDSNGRALFDVDGVQLSLHGGTTLTHTAEQLEEFMREVGNE